MINEYWRTLLNTLWLLWLLLLCIIHKVIGFFVQKKNINMNNDLRDRIAKID